MDNLLIVAIVLGLSVWRIARLLATEHGPYDVMDKVRYALGVKFDENSRAYGTTELSRGVLCVWCSSVWFSFIFVILYLLWHDFIWLALPLALSTIAIAVETVISK